jgi:hypothetical protein
MSGSGNADDYKPNLFPLTSVLPAKAKNRNADSVTVAEQDCPQSNVQRSGDPA